MIHPYRDLSWKAHNAIPKDSAYALLPISSIEQHGPHMPVGTDDFILEYVLRRLTGDPAVIYRRFLERDQSPQRHRGHVVNTGYPEPPGRRPLAAPITLEQFVAGFQARGMGDFDPGGPRIMVDVTDFETLDYEGLVEQVRVLMREKA